MARMEEVAFFPSISLPLLRRGGTLHRSNPAGTAHASGVARCRLNPRSAATAASKASVNQSPIDFMRVSSAATALVQWCEGVVERFEGSALGSKAEGLKHHNSGLSSLVGISSSNCIFRHRLRDDVSTSSTDSVKIDPDTIAIGRETRGECTHARLRPKRHVAIAVAEASGLYGTIAQLAGRCQAADLWTHVLGVTTSALAPLVMPGGALATASASGIVTAFCPLPLSFPDLNQCLPMPQMPNLSMQELERGVFVATFVQGTLGIVRIFSGDLFSGSYTLLLATLGYNARHPGPASNWLKTYVLITFINGTMSCIDLVQQQLNGTFPAVLLSLPISVNMAHLATMLMPAVSFLGAYCGWQHIKEQRKQTLDQYTLQIEHMLQNPPWPPPPLPQQIVHSMVQYSLQQAQLGDAAMKGSQRASATISMAQAKALNIRDTSGTGRGRLARVDEETEEEPGPEPVAT